MAESALPSSENVEENAEYREWIESLEEVISNDGPEKAASLLQELILHAERRGLELPVRLNSGLHPQLQRSLPAQLPQQYQSPSSRRAM